MSFCANVNLGLPTALTNTLVSCTDISTGWPTANLTDLAIDAGIRNAKLLPHC